MVEGSRAVPQHREQNTIRVHMGRMVQQSVRRPGALYDICNVRRRGKETYLSKQNPHSSHQEYLVTLRMLSV